MNINRNNLDLLTNSELIAELERLVAEEKKITLEVVRHLSEVEERKLFLVLGYSSMFDYATRGLGYSDSGAMRRIKVARAGAKVPEVFTYLTEKKVTLSALSACSDALIKQDGKEVLEKLTGKTREEAEWISASYKPVAPQSVKDKIKKVVVSSLTPEADLFSAPQVTDAEQTFPTKSLCNRSGCEEKFKISFSAGQEFMKKLERVQELVFSGRAEDLLLENIFGEALELYIEKHCPQKKQERREAREAKKEVEVTEAELTTQVFEIISEVEVTAHSKDNNTKSSRYIPKALRDQVLKRDNYQCSYTSPDGVRCSCRKNLEIDHIIAFAVGGRSELENLRVLCSAHNLHAASLAFGAEFIERKIAGT